MVRQLEAQHELPNARLRELEAAGEEQRLRAKIARRSRARLAAGADRVQAVESGPDLDRETVRAMFLTASRAAGSASSAGDSDERRRSSRRDSTGPPERPPG